MSKTAQRSLQTADYNRAVGVKTADYIAVNRQSAVGAFAVFAACGVGIVVPFALGYGVVRDHTVDITCRHHKTEPRLAELCEVAVVFYIRLSEKRDLTAAVL